MDLLKMAQDAGFDVHPSKGEIRGPFDFTGSDITGVVAKFAHMVAAAEREACAKEVESMRTETGWIGKRETSARIRKRSNAKVRGASDD